MDKKIGIGVGVILLNKDEKVLLLLRNSDYKIADRNTNSGQYDLNA